MELWQQTARELSYRLMSRYSFVLARMSKEHYRQDLELFLEPFLEELEKAAREDQGKMDSSWEEDSREDKIADVERQLDDLARKVTLLVDDLEDLRDELDALGD